MTRLRPVAIGLPVALAVALAACSQLPTPLPSPGRSPLSSETVPATSPTTASPRRSAPADPTIGLVVLSEGGVLAAPGGWMALADLPRAHWLAATATGLAVTMPDSILLGDPRAGAEGRWRELVPRWGTMAPHQPLAAAIASPWETAAEATFAVTTMDLDTGAATVSVVAHDGPARLLQPVEAMLWPAASWVDGVRIAFTVLGEGIAGSLCVELIDTATGGSTAGPCGRNLILTGNGLALVASHTRDAASLVGLDAWLAGTASSIADFSERDAALETAALDGAGVRLALGWWDGAARTGALKVYENSSGAWRQAATLPLAKTPLGLAWLP